MSFRAILGSCTKLRRITPSLNTSQHFYSSIASKPLRILFCGSDDFSCVSLKALHAEQGRDPANIASIDVLCRPGKPAGRGLKTVREVPIKAAAQSLGIPIHERDTFTGWTLPKPHGEPISLLVAVSFGLFVPSRILNSTEFGGINVHPSMLPDFRGPAPLQHTLLAAEKHTGVTLQTLHPEKFDHGKILAQTSQPGFEIPNGGQCTYAELLQFITPKAADLLVQGIRDRVFDPRVHKNINIPNTNRNGRPLRHAPKITPEDRHVSFTSMTAYSICQRDRALGRLWSIVRFEDDSKRRVVFDGLEAVSRPKEMSDFFESRENVGNVFKPLSLVANDDEVNTVPMMRNPSGGGIIVATRGKEALQIREATVDGKRKMDAAQALFGHEKEDNTKNDDGGSTSYSLADIPMLIAWDIFI